MLNLFGSTTSPFVRHCRIALREESHPFELVIADYATSEQQSPTSRVPYAEEGDVRLTDSSAILHYIRTQHGKNFLATSAIAENYFLANTALDTAINLFLLERDNITDSPYITRQKNRLVSCFAQLEQVASAWDGQLNDAVIRLGCLLDWINYRNRFDFSKHQALVSLHKNLSENTHFKATEPPPV